ncbi:MAG: isochorismatase family cysteine hydrolase [Pseudomonadota bacterium]
MNTAIIIIDMLEDFFRDGPLLDIRSELTAQINRLTRWGRAKNLPVIWIRQAFKEDLSDAYLVMRKNNIHITIEGTQGCQVLDELDKSVDDYEIVKKRYSAFFGTTLDDLLERLNVNTLILAGINTHACVRTTAIDAYQRDLEIMMPHECIASYDAEHHAITLQYLDKRIASIVSLPEVLVLTT